MFALQRVLTRPRPFDVTIIGRWRGFSFPSAPVAVVDDHRGRDRLLDGRARSAAHDREGRRDPSSSDWSPSRGSISPSTTRSTSSWASRSASRCRSTRSASSCPNEVFPVAYRQGKTAHLDVGGRRGEAIREAVEQQLGVTVLDMQAGRARRLGRFDPAAAPCRGRPGHVPVREALRDEPRARRPLVQDRPHDPLRTPRGRSAVPVRAAAGPVRGLHAASHARLRHPDRRRRRASSSSRPSANTCSSPSSSTARRRSATPTSTTPSSTRASR